MYDKILSLIITIGIIFINKLVQLNSISKLKFKEHEIKHSYNKCIYPYDNSVLESFKKIYQHDYLGF